MTPKNKRANILQAKIVIAIILVGCPPLASVLFNIGPGYWANTVQDRMLGGHSLEISLLAVLFFEFACFGVVAIGVKLLTGRTIVQLFLKNNSESDKSDDELHY